MEEVGLSLVAQGADQFLADLDRADKAVNDFARGVDDAAGKADAGAGMFSGLGGVLSGGFAAGAGIAAGAVIGIGAAIGDAQARLGEFRSVLGQDFSVEQFQGLNEQTAALQRQFGAELPAQLDAARQLVANGLAPDFASAMDIIAAGFAEGLNVGDDLLDTLREYSPNFGALGISGEEALGIINRGLEAGARNSDVVADAVKEFGILIREPGTIEAVAALDEGLGGIVTQFQSGQIAGDEALSLITARLGEIEDPIQRNQAGIALFGTLYEDMGEQAILALGRTSEGLVASEGAAEAATNRITSFGDILPMLGDKLATALAPAADGMLDFANSVLAAEDPVAEVGTQLQQFGANAIGAIQAALPGFTAKLGEMAQRLGGWVQEGLPEMLAKLGEARNALVGWVLESIPGWSAKLAELGGKLGQWVVDALPGLGTNLGRVTAVVLEGAGELIAVAVPKLLELGAKFVGWVATDVLPNLPGKLVQVGGAILSGVGNFLTEVSPKLVELGQKFINWVQEEVLPNLPGKLAEIGGAIVDGIGDFIGNVASEAGAVGDAVIDGMVEGVNRGVGAITQAARDAASAALDAAKDFLGISSPSKEFMEIGADADRGFAHGILDNVDLLLDAAGAISRAVLDEAGGLAEEIRSAVGPMLADGFRGAADFARSRLGTLDLLGGFGDLEAPEAPEEVAEVDLGRLNTLKAQQAAARREFERALAGPVRTERDVQRLNDLEERRRLADEALAQEEERVRLARLSRAEEQAERQEAFAEAQRVYEAQRDIQQRAAAELEALEAQARQITNPAERAAFYDLRQRQIREIVEAELQGATARSELEQRIARDRLAAIREAQQFETQLARQEAQTRQSGLRDQIRIAEEAAGRLTNLVGFSQEDLFGSQDPAIAGVGATLGTMLSGLGQQVGGPATLYGLLTALLGGGGGVSNVTNFNYNPSYGAAPNAPMQDFAIMQSLYGAGA